MHLERKISIGGRTRSALACAAVRAMLVFALLCASALPALAHARLLASTPRESSLLAGSPKSIELWFNELLDDDFNTIEVFSSNAPGGDRPNLAGGAAKVDADNRTHLAAPLSRLAPGTYLVEWKVLSRDGHTARGRFSFRVLPDRDGAY